MLGALVVSLGLDAADFVNGMSKSEQQAKRFASTLDRNIAVGIVKAEVALRGLATAARTSFAIFQNLTEGAAVFKDLEETTGASAEGLAGFAVAAMLLVMLAIPAPPTTPSALSLTSLWPATRLSCSRTVQVGLPTPSAVLRLA